MCVHFFNFDHFRITLQSSVLIWGTKFRAPLSLSLHSYSPTFKLLSMTSYSGELLLESSSPWSSVSNHLSSISIPLPSIFKKQRTPLMKKIQGLQAPHGATSPLMVFQKLLKRCDFSEYISKIILLVINYSLLVIDYTVTHWRIMTFQFEFQKFRYW